MPQRPVIEVGAQRDDDPNPRAGGGDELDELIDEPGRSVVVDLREQLLELVDDQQQLVVVAGQDAMDGAAHTAWGEHQVEQRGRWVRRDSQQRRLELLERMGGRCHLDPEPVRRHRQRPLRQRRQHPSSNRARLTTPARPDDGHEPSPGAGCAEAGDQPFDETFAPEELPRVGGTERTQPLVGVLDLVVVEQRRSR